MRIQIATGNSRMEKRWNNVEMELDGGAAKGCGR